jgi:hypothetical protein
LGASGADCLARVVFFGITNGAGFVNLFCGQTSITKPHRFSTRNGAFIRAAYFFPLLRRVVFVGKAARLLVWGDRFSFVKIRASA